MKGSLNDYRAHDNSSAHGPHLVSVLRLMDFHPSCFFPTEKAQMSSGTRNHLL